MSVLSASYLFTLIDLEVRPLTDPPPWLGETLHSFSSLREREINMLLLVNTDPHINS